MNIPIWRINHLVEVDSTNRWLADAAREGAPSGTVCYADFQTAGRGRHDHSWEAPARSGLLCSLLLEQPADGPGPQWASVAVALATRFALARLAGIKVDLKWPNDLLVGSEKLGGLLAQRVSDVDGRWRVVVGIGVNLTTDGPPGAGGISVARAGGVTVTAEALLDDMLGYLERGWVSPTWWSEQLRDEYRRVCVTIGHDIVASTSTGDIAGVATSVDDDGSLVVTSESGDIVVAAGDVRHVRRPTGERA